MNDNTQTIILRQARLVRNRLITKCGNSDGYCYEASCTLGMSLEDLGIKTTLIAGRVTTGEKLRFHYWINIENSILDITGDQFNKYLPNNQFIPNILYAPEVLCNLYRKDSIEAYPIVNWMKV